MTRRLLTVLAAVTSVLTMLPTASVTAQTPFTVSSLAAWQDTGILVVAGDTIIIEASGVITFDSAGQTVSPDGTPGAFAGAPGGACAYLICSGLLQSQALVGRIGNGALTNFAFSQDTSQGFFVGTRFVARAAVSGRLFLGFNDGFVRPDRTGLDAGGVGDNSGSFETAITLRRGFVCTLDGPGDSCVYDLVATGDGALKIATRPTRVGGRVRATVAQSNTNSAVTVVGTGSASVFSGSVGRTVYTGRAYVLLVTYEGPLPGAFATDVIVRITGPVMVAGPRPKATCLRVDGEGLEEGTPIPGWSVPIDPMASGRTHVTAVTRSFNDSAVKTGDGAVRVNGDFYLGKELDTACKGVVTIDFWYYPQPGSSTNSTIALFGPDVEHYVFLTKNSEDRWYGGGDVAFDMGPYSGHYTHVVFTVNTHTGRYDLFLDGVLRAWQLPVDNRATVAGGIKYISLHSGRGGGGTDSFADNILIMRR